MSDEGKNQPNYAIPVLDPDGKTSGEAVVPAELLVEQPCIEILQRTIVDHHLNKRRGTQSVRNRSDVRGGGRKPWRQKGTGRARHGSIRSPLWRGGGKALNVQRHAVSRYLSKRERHRAFASALSLKLSAGRIIVVDSLELPNAGTKRRVEWLAGMGLDGDVLLVDEKLGEDLLRSTRNLRNVSVARADTLSTYEVLAADHLVVSRLGLAALQRSGRHGSA